MGAEPCECCTHPDCDELRKFKRYLARRAENPHEPMHYSYAQIYGVTVYTAPTGENR